MEVYTDKENTHIWLEKGATLTDGSACKEFGLSRQDIIDAIVGGKLQYRQISIYGNPCLRLLRHEVEAIVIEKFGDDYLSQKKLKKELSLVNKDLRKLKSEIEILEQRKITLSRALNSIH
jgi:hypothetical protein